MAGTALSDRAKKPPANEQTAFSLEKMDMWKEEYWQIRNG
jgi:hypothetical protein